MSNEKKPFGLGTKILALAMVAAIFGVGAALGANSLALPDRATAESLTAMSMQGASSSELDSPFKAVYQEVNQSVVGVKLATQMRVFNNRIQTESAFVGSGVAIGDEYVVTNYHVVTANSNQVASGITVLFGGEEYTAEYVAGDEESDVAVLKVAGLPAPAAKLGNSDELSVGDWAIVIGNPLGEKLSNTLTIGVISGTERVMSSTSPNGRTASSNPMIQTNAQINSGNSGGGLFNIRGELVGITSMKLSNNGYWGSASIEGIGFAIPINTVTKIADDLIEYGEVMYPRLGVGVQSLPSSAEEPSKDALPASIWVLSVEKGSPAEAAGIKTDDLITAVDGQRVKTYEELQAILRAHNVGDVVEVTVYRVPNVRNIKEEQDIPDGEFITFPVELQLVESTVK